jgi:hypothetical protein
MEMEMGYGIWNMELWRGIDGHFDRWKPSFFYAKRDKYTVYRLQDGIWEGVFITTVGYLLKRHPLIFFI